MDIEEIISLLKVIEESGRHGQTFKNIHAAATERLLEIEADLEPEKPEVEPPEVAGVVGDNPPPSARPEADGVDNDNDGEVDESDEAEPVIHYDDQGQRIPHSEADHPSLRRP